VVVAGSDNLWVKNESETTELDAKREHWPQDLCGHMGSPEVCSLTLSGHVMFPALEVSAQEMSVMFPALKMSLDTFRSRNIFSHGDVT
jgi:hypothetical protein